MIEVSPLVLALLERRGITNEAEAGIFLSPEYERDLHDPFLLKNMDKAVGRIMQAVEKNEKVAIVADYDADGIPAAVILSEFFKKTGFENFSVTVPHRNTEGFGLNDAAVERFIAEKVDLIITLDCGMGDAERVAQAEAAGIDVIVVDHHLPNHAVPNAFAIINPNQEGDAYPNKNLCGAGVTFKLVCALLTQTKDVPQEWSKWLLDLVAIATLSDMVPLVGENRCLAKYGLLVLRKSRRVGLHKLFEKCRIRQSELTEDDIIFTITPRINAASRMDEPEVAFRLLSTDDEAEAETLAEHLTKINNERKGAVAAMAKEIKKKLEDRAEETAVVVVGNPHWQPGLLGLAANHVVDAYKRPAFVWGRGASQTIRGSCRSDGSVDMVALMSAASGAFIEFGGHSRSGGFSVSVEQVEELSVRLNAAYEEMRDAGGEVRVESNRTADATLSLDDVTWENFNDIQRLAPFGMGNPKPVFLFENISVARAERFGKSKEHVRLSLAAPSGGFIPAIQFFAPDDGALAKVAAGDTINLLAHLEKNTFNGSSELRLRIVEVLK